MLPLPVETVEPLMEPVLLWCVRGSATVVIGADETTLAEGDGLWVPVGARMGLAIGHRDVVLPVPGIGNGDASTAMRVVIPPSWRPWILHAFGEALVYLDGESSRDRLSALLGRARREASSIAPPAAPSSPELGVLAAAIERTPALPVAELARRFLPGWSPRTLQRRFVQETGLTPGSWARRHRLELAARLLAAGGEVHPVAQRVGYATVSGFSRQFSRAMGMAPGRWRDTSGPRGMTVLRPAPIDHGERLPPQRTWLRANGAHVAVWIVQGTATVTVAGGETTLAQGDAMVIPAGMPNSIRVSRGSLLLPVGYRSGRSVGVALPDAPATVTEADEVDMLHAMVSAYTPVRARGADVFAGIDRVLAAAGGAPTDDDVAVAAVASALATGEVADETLAGCAAWLGVSERELSRIVNRRTGLTFAQWLRVSRMSRARVQLHGGAPASAVSRRLGYAHLPAFSRAFREVHGTSPRHVPVVSPRERRTA
ncbi:helix-turn-helix domain-containing protein [Microbacterium sp. NPDC008134]|uniref:helix-turn-helix domain-containing protein n=1 Tax=Microbacterium sp. NPDC008134 TaxID=3364183 RepID=UPI0036E64BA6